MTLESIGDQSILATVRGGRVHLEGPLDWPDGTKVSVTPIAPLAARCRLDGHVIIVGFGLSGRCVADLLDHAKLPYRIVEKNPVTVETQRALGRDILKGDVLDLATLHRAGLAEAAVFALTIPDEEAVLRAIALARRERPDLYIIARTNYASKGMKASQLGANDVIKAEQAVAWQFYEKLSRRIRRNV